MMEKRKDLTDPGGTSVLCAKNERVDSSRAGHSDQSARDHLYSGIGLTVRQMNVIIAGLVILLVAAFIVGVFL